MVQASIQRQGKKGHPGKPLILSLKLPEHLKVTTLRGLSIIPSAVAGFLPFRSFFSLMQYFSNPLINEYVSFKGGHFAYT